MVNIRMRLNDNPLGFQLLNNLVIIIVFAQEEGELKNEEGLAKASLNPLFVYP